MRVVCLVCVVCDILVVHVVRELCKVRHEYLVWEVRMVYVVCVCGTVGVCVVWYLLGDACGIFGVCGVVSAG